MSSARRFRSWIAANWGVCLFISLIVAAALTLLLWPALSTCVGEALKGLRTVVVELLFLFLVASLGVVVYRALQESVITLEQISVADSLAKKGYTGTAVTQQILSEFQKIVIEARSNVDVREQVRQLAVTELVQESQLPDLQVPGTEFSLQGAIRYVKRALGGSDVRAGGTLLEDWSLRLWLNTGTSYLVEPLASQNLQELANKGAQLLVDDISPGYLASYLHNKSGQRERAEASARRCLARAQNNAERRAAYMIWAMILHYYRDDESAIEKYRLAERDDRTSVSLYIAWGNVYYEQHAYEDALAKYGEAEKADNGQLGSLIKMNRGLVHYDKAGRAAASPEDKSREYDVAIREYEEAARGAGDDRQLLSLVHMNLANAYDDYAEVAPKSRDAHLDAARKWALKAIEADPSSAFSYNTLGLIQKRRADLGGGRFDAGLVDDALRQFRYAVEADPNFADAHYNAGRVHWERRQFQEAIREFNEAIRCDAHSVNAFTDRGLVQLDLGAPEKAIEDLNHAKSLDPQCVHAYIGLGRVLVAQGKFADAVVELEAALKIRDSADARVALAEALMQQGKLDGAIEQFRTAKELRKDGLYAYTGLGRALTKKQDFDGAVKVFREALALNPDSSDAHSDLGDALTAKGDLKEAAAELDQARKLDPDSRYPYAGLGRLAEKEGNTQAAIAAYSEAIELRHPDADQLKERLRALQKKEN